MPKATPLLTTVAVRVASPKRERVALPLRSPASVIVGDLLITVSEAMSPALISTLFNTGAVSVLFVKVCVPVSVATVLSMATVSVCPEPEVSSPVPPKILKTCESRSTLCAPPLSPWKSMSCEVT